jgi:hypothetical protein
LELRLRHEGCNVRDGGDVKSKSLNKMALVVVAFRSRYGSITVFGRIMQVLYCLPAAASGKTCVAIFTSIGTTLEVEGGGE